MAYVIGTKNNTFVESTIELQRYGLVFPLTSEFKVSTNIIDQIKSNLINLLRTVKGERVMQPNFGCDLIKLVFEPNTDFFNERIEDEIESAVSFWMPFIIIENIDIQSSNEDKDFNRVYVHLTFKLDGQSTIQEITFPITQG